MNAAATALMGLDVGHPDHEAKLNALTVAELRTVCTHFGLVSTGVKAALVVCAQVGIDGAGAMVDVQSRLHVHLFGPPLTPTETVHAACDAELASALLSAAASDNDPAEHSAAGAWLASGLRYLLGRQVTTKAFWRLKIRFRRTAHDEVVFAQDMKPGDPGFVQFVEAWVTRIIAVMPLPNAMTAEDAEATLSDVLRAFGAPAGPRADPSGAPQPLDWLAELRRTATTKPAAARTRLTTPS